MRKLGIDYGKRRTGVAISDFNGIIAMPLETFASGGVRKDVDYVAEIVASRQIDTIVLGMPYNMDGTKGKRAKDTEFFGKVLQKVINIPVIYVDERLTSVEANDKLIEANVSVQNRKKAIDQVAAQIILQQYIDSTLQKK